MCFLEREVYAFLSTFDKRGERVRGAMPRARIFVYRRAAGEGGGPAADGPQAARARGRGQSSAGGMSGESCAGKGKTDVFLFLGEKISRYFLSLLDGDNSSRSAATAALGYRCRRENGAGELRHKMKPSL